MTPFDAVRVRFEDADVRAREDAEAVFRLDDDPALDDLDLVDPELLDDEAALPVVVRVLVPADLVFDADDRVFDAVALPADEVFDFVDDPVRDVELPDDLAAVLLFADEPFDDDLPVEREPAADLDFTDVDEDFAFDADDFDPPDFDADDFAEPDLELEDFLVVAMIFLRVFK